MRDLMPLSREIHQLAVEELLAMFSPRGRHHQLAIAPDEIRIDYPAPAHQAEYEKLYDCAIRFGMDAVESWIPAKVLNQRSSLSNAEMARICEECCRAILARLGAGGSTTERMRSHLVGGARDFGRASVAKRMGMTPRTLARKLHDEGTTYRTVVSDVRKSLVLDYLESTDLGLEEIADLLGYEDGANFNRALRSWVGQSPGRYRRRLRAEVAGRT